MGLGKRLRKAIGKLLLFGAVAVPFCALAQTGAPGTEMQTGQPVPSEHKISEAEAKDLFRSVDEILKFASEESSLPRRSDVKRRLVSRDEVVAFISKHLEEDEDSQRLQRNEIVLKKFGLLPRDFDLKMFLIAMLREQVAGYYDPKTKTVNLLDWVDAEQQKPVLAHELTHALQDQSFDLETWMRAGSADLLNVENPTAADFADDEAGEARQAVTEGQATVVLIDYGLAPFGQSMASSPKLVEAMRAGMLAGTADSIQFRNAPLFLKEALIFPYSYGLDFVGEVIVKRGKEGAVDLFRHPPSTTRQIMEPQTFLSGEKLEPIPVPDFKQLLKDYKKIDVGGFGEFDTAMLVDQFAGAETGSKMYPEWRGGYYFALRPKADSAAPLGLLYVSRWSSAEKASEFAAVYANSLPTRYRRVEQVVREDAPADARLDKLENLTGKHLWKTEDGPVLIEVQGDSMVVVESLQDAARLSRAVWDAMSSAISPDHQPAIIASPAKR